jgi:hypothetical protein
MHISDLEALLPKQFRGNLSKAERLLVNRAPLGTPANCSQIGHATDSDLQIRANLIRWLCLGEDLAKNVDPRGLTIGGARSSVLWNSLSQPCHFLLPLTDAASIPMPISSTAGFPRCI